MKKYFVIILFLAVAVATIGLLSCASNAPAPPANAPAQTSSSNTWATVSQYYHTYVAGLIAPVGLAAATIADPAAGPAIALASKEVSNLDNLLAAKASDASVASQVAIVDKAVIDANAKVGAVLTAATSAVPMTAPAPQTGN